MELPQEINETQRTPGSEMEFGIRNSPRGVIIQINDSKGKLLAGRREEKEARRMDYSEDRAESRTPTELKPTQPNGLCVC